MADPRIIEALMRQGNFGLAPYDRSKNKPVDMGLGGLSTEYLATEYDANGNDHCYVTMFADDYLNEQYEEMGFGRTKRESLQEAYAFINKYVTQTEMKF